MMSVRVSLLCCAVALSAAVLHAAPPEVKSLYPAGGQRGTTVEVTVGGKLDKTAQVWSAREGVTAAVSEKGDKATVTISADAAPGVCWLRFHNAEGASALRPFVVGTLPEVVEEEPNDAFRAAQKLDASSAVVNGVLSKSGEVDTFAVPLVKGQTLVASVDAHRTFGSPMDGVLQVLSPRGFVIEQNDDAPGLDPQLIYTAEDDGLHAVRVFAFPATPNSSIRLAGGADYLYRLTLTTGPFADHAEPLVVTQGTDARVKLVGWNIPVELGEQSVAWDADGRPLPVGHPHLANTVPLQTAPHATTIEQAAAAADTPQEIAPPITLTGGVREPGETDAYRFRGTKGQNVVLQVAARGLGSPLDPVLTLIGPDGKTVKEADDSTRNVADPELTVALPADGEYRVQISDLHHRGGARFVYALTVRPETPTYSLRVAADAFTAAPGKPLEIPVTVTRTGGFDGEIEISLAGLPDGVTAAPVKSAAKGDTAKAVKLALTAPSAAPWSGPIRIVGRVAEDGPPEQTATAAISGTTAQTRDLWLTIQGKPASP